MGYMYLLTVLMSSLDHRGTSEFQAMSLLSLSSFYYSLVVKYSADFPIQLFCVPDPRHRHSGD